MKITSDFLKELIRQQIVLERSVNLPKGATPDEDQIDVGVDDDEEEADAVDMAGGATQTGAGAAPATKGKKAKTAPAAPAADAAADDADADAAADDPATDAKSDVTPKKKKKKSSVPYAFRRKNVRMAYMQDMLYRALLKANLMKPGEFGKKRHGMAYLPGADGIYGKGTQRAINRLRKNFPNAPRRHPNFKVSVERLISYLKKSVDKDMATAKAGRDVGSAIGAALGKAPDTTTPEPIGEYFGENPTPEQVKFYCKKYDPSGVTATCSSGASPGVTRATGEPIETLEESKNLKNLFKKFL